MTNDDNFEEEDSSTTLEDFSRYKEGDIFGPLKKKIHIMILLEVDYIVFLDEKLYVHWYYNSRYAENGFAEDYGEVVIREANLEATSILLLKKSRPLKKSRKETWLESQKESQLEVFRRLLGESIGRLLDERKSNNAQEMLDKAEVFLRARSREKARMWYLSATLAATVLMLIGGLFLWIYRQKVMAVLGVEDAFIEVMLGTTMGSLGALISVLLRSDELEIDVSAGRKAHYFEGLMRVLVGAAAGLIFALAIKSNILFGAVNRSEKTITILLVITIIAGVSERLLPSLIKQLEGTLVTQVTEVEFTTQDGQEGKGPVRGKTPTNDVEGSSEDKKKKRRFFRFRKRNRG